MTHDDVKEHLETNITLRLLRSPNAPLILSFLHAQFKQKPRVTIPQNELIEHLEILLDTLRSHTPDSYKSSPRKYLSAWCSKHHEYLRKYYEAASDEPVYELTPDAERALQWLEDLKKSSFIGTESRFLQIFGLLNEIVDESTEDVEIRIRQLQQQKAELEQRIAEIQENGLVDRYNDTQIKERFYKASEEARRLLADFREVEGNFRDITRSVQEQRLLEDATKGDIVGYVLDADTALADSDQGRSFNAFWQFLISPTRKQELRNLLERVFALPELTKDIQNSNILRNITHHLSEAGVRIVQSNHRLAQQLRRMLEEAQLRENRRVFELVDEIKKCAIDVKEKPPQERDFFDAEGKPMLNLHMERRLWSPPDRPRFDHKPMEIDEEELEGLDISELFDLFTVERDQLEQHIEDVLMYKSQATLCDVVEAFPVERGLSEVITYMAIATDTRRHTIDDSVTESVTIKSPNNLMREISLPRIIFTR
ncbi:MAG: DUF3375 domain-containing protein [Rhodothermales bacterium]